MEFNYFDLIVVIIVMLLGLKGIINGFLKELFGLIGIVGGLFIASRMDKSVGTAINDMLFHFESDAAVTFTGFLVTLAVFWLLMIGLGMMFKKLVTISGLGIFDRILGFIFGSGKFFFIASVIVFAVFNIKVIQENLGDKFDDSVMFSMMRSTGGFIMQLDPVDVVDDLNETLESAKLKIEQNLTEINMTSNIIDQESFKKIVIENVDMNTSLKKVTE